MFTWVFPKIGVPQNGWFIMANPMNKWMIWGVLPPLFLVQHPHGRWQNEALIHSRKHIHNKINPKDCQVLSLGDSGFLQFFSVVSSDYGKPRYTAENTYINHPDPLDHQDLEWMQAEKIATNPSSSAGNRKSPQKVGLSPWESSRPNKVAGLDWMIHVK